jgi:hypothetical protein
LFHLCVCLLHPSNSGTPLPAPSSPAAL